jgi:hypoxanthine phosphoribosyltransferase
MSSPSPVEAELQNNTLLITHRSEVKQAIKQMAKEITLDLSNANPLVYVTMNGGLFLAGQLLPRLNFPLEQAYLHASRYGEKTVDVGNSPVEWLAEPSQSPKDRTVLVLDDIFDEGHTLAVICARLAELGAKQVYTAVLVNKRHDRKNPTVAVDYVGLDLPDLFLFGCGMDYKGYWRNLREIHAVKNPNPVAPQ